MHLTGAHTHAHKHTSIEECTIVVLAAQAALTKYHRPGSLNNRHSRISHSPEVRD